MAHVTLSKPVRKETLSKPRKPYKDFPLSPHSSGCWVKKIRGQFCYFGRWKRIVKGKPVRVEGDGWQEALTLYKAQADDLHSGRTPRPKAAEGELTVGDLCNRFFIAKQRRLQAGELSPRTFAEYQSTTDRLVKTFGAGRLVSDLRPEDFGTVRSQLAKQFGPVRLGNEIQRIRTVFKFAFDNGLIDKPILYGSEFAKPAKSVMRKHRAQSGQRMFEASELRILLAHSTGQLRAMILLGINAGFGQSDCATLPLSAVNLDQGWIDFPRPKTGIPRRIPLWPETVEALRHAIAVRRTAVLAADQALVFLAPRGLRWVRAEGRTKVDGIGIEFNKLLSRHTLKQPGRSFYALRHSFRTVADAARDQVAANSIMGHADGSMAGVYRERIEDDRLRAVVDHVHAWLYPADQLSGPTLGVAAPVPEEAPLLRIVG